MACANCGKKSKSFAVIRQMASPTGYVYGDDGFTTLVYTAGSVQKFVGKCSRKTYLFGVGAIVAVDACDAVELLKLRWFELEKKEEEVPSGEVQVSASEEDSA